jgi:hypothetical protein
MKIKLFGLNAPAETWHAASFITATLQTLTGFKTLPGLFAHATI